MTTITREQQKQILIDTANHVISRDNTSPYSENLRELARIALASLEAEPIGAFHIEDQQVSGTTDYIKDGEWPIDNSVIEVYAAPPAPVVPEKMNFSTACNFVQINGMAKEDRATLAMRAWNACRAAMLHGAEPVSQTYNLPELIEGMEVSIDVSTCDADAGNRYFGTVTEVSELYTAKNGYILLVQDAEPNFDVNGNASIIPDGYALVPVEPTDEMIEAAMNCEDVTYNESDDTVFYVHHREIYKAMLAAAPKPQNAPQNIPAGKSTVTPDGWISCSERIPEIRQTVIGWNGYAVRQCVYTRNEYAKTQKGREPRFEILTGIWHGVTHWMPLPEPPQQEVK